MTTEQTDKLVRLIKSTQPNPATKGRLFTVTFVKKDGSLRTMKARLGMRRNLKGKGFSYDPATKGYMPVWSADSQGYRMLNINTITELKLGNKTYAP